MRFSITIFQSHYNQLKDHLIKEDQKERAAFIICGRSFAEGLEERFLSREIVCINAPDLLTSTVSEVSWDNNIFIRLLKVIENKNLGLIVVHNHLQEYNHFSAIDDEGEKNLFKIAFNRNGSSRPFGSIIMLSDGSLFGRVWNSDLNHTPFSLIRVIGETIKIWYPDKTKNYITPEAFNRQQIAFGKSLTQDFSKLKIAVVGAGATGSNTALLLTRLGIGEIILIDKDIIEESNLNRLHGSRIKDIGHFKVDILKDHIESIGLKTKVVAIKDWISTKDDVFNQLKTSDIVFGCTDDNAGRILLNRLAYFYLIPVFDMGLIISIKNFPPEIKDLQGRISYIFPGSDCLLTKGNINIDLAYSENLKRNEPDNFERLKKEAYVIGEGDPSPAVVTFTTLVSTLAVNDLLNRFVSFNPNGLVPHKMYFINRDVIICPSNEENNDCRICGSTSYWGRGDMQPILDLVM